MCKNLRGTVRWIGSRFCRVAIPSTYGIARFSVAISFAAAAAATALADQFFRLTITDNAGTDSACIIQLSRMCFYDSAGNVVSDGLTKAADGASAGELGYGEVSQALAYNAPANDPSTLFADNGDKWCFNNENGGARKNGGAYVLTMRLAKDAATAVAYNFRAGNDDNNYPTRSLGAWRLEGSTDGVSWTMVDEHSCEVPVGASFAWYNNGIPYDLIPLIWYEKGLLDVGCDMAWSSGEPYEFNAPTTVRARESLRLESTDGDVVAYLTSGQILKIDVPSGATRTLRAYADDLVSVGSAEISGHTGATVHNYGIYTAYEFKDPSTVNSLTISKAGRADILLVGGGGAGGATIGGGGGGGQVVFLSDVLVRPGVFGITVGAGGTCTADNWPAGENGRKTQFGAYSAIGGGGGGSWHSPNGCSGANGGGGSNGGAGGAAAVSGGFAGGATYSEWTGGGGGAGGAGCAGGSAGANTGGAGGPGLANAITGETVYYGAGGGGGAGNGCTTPGEGGQGGGGAGSAKDSGESGGNGAAGTGSGGGGGSYNPGTAGGSGGCGCAVVCVWTIDPDSTEAVVVFDGATGGSNGSVAVAWRVKSLGKGSEGVTFKFAYGTEAGVYPYTNVLAESSRALGSASAIVQGLRLGATYHAELLADNGIDPVRSVSGDFTFTTESESIDNFYVNMLPGLMQGRLPGSSNRTGTLEDATDVRRELGPVQGFVCWKPTAPVPYTSEIDGVQTFWGEDTTFLYQGYVHLEAGKTYSFYGRQDDNIYVTIGGTAVLASSGACNPVSGTHSVEETGWYPVDIRLCNGSVNGGYYASDIPNPVFTTDEEPSADHAEWPLFKDPGDGSLFRVPYDNPIEILSARRDGQVLVLEFSLSRFLVGSTLSVYAADGYRGTSMSDWGTPVATFSVADSTTVGCRATVPAGTRYVRAATVSNGITFLSEALPLVEVEACSIEPSATVYSFDPDVTVAAGEDGAYTVSVSGPGSFTVLADYIAVRNDAGVRTPYGVLAAGMTVVIDDVSAPFTIELAPWTDAESAKVVHSDDVNVSGGPYRIVDFGPQVFYFLTQTNVDYSVTFSDSGRLDVLVVGGGGAGGTTIGGGGGGGQVVERSGMYVIGGVAYAARVGAGGEPYTASDWKGPGGNGGESSFFDIAASGGGGGGSWSSSRGCSGANGGGAANSSQSAGQSAGGSGYAGGVAGGDCPGGGGGAGGAGEAGGTVAGTGGAGGPGIVSEFTNESVSYGAGGGGGAGNSCTTPGLGGSANAGTGGARNSGQNGGDGVDGTGSGGGGGSWSPQGNGGRGGSGVVVLRVRKTGYDGSPFGSLSVSSVAFATASIDWALTYLGDDVESLDLEVRYSCVDSGVERRATIGSNLSGPAHGSLTFEGLSAGKSYTVRLYADAGDGFAAIGAPVSFETPSDGECYAGFRESRVSGSRLDATFDILAQDDVKRTLGAMASVTVQNTPWAAWYDGNVETTSIWEHNTTIGYWGYVYFEDAPHTFGAKMDDNVQLRIVTSRGDFVFSQGGNTLSCSNAWTPPDGAGWYETEIRVYDGTGNSGPYGGFVGLAFNTKGLTTYTAANASEWKTFVDPGDASFIRCGEPKLRIGSCYRDGGNVMLAAIFGDGMEGYALQLGFAGDYAGFDGEVWTWIAQTDVIGTEESVRKIEEAIPQGATYLRLRAVSPDSSAVYFTSAFALADIAVLDATKPVVEFQGASPASVSADVAFLVASCGGAESCNVMVSYGFSPDAMTQTATFSGIAEGVHKVTLSGLCAGRTYYASMHADNGENVSDETPVLSFTTLDAVTEGAFAPGRAGLSRPGLWQAYKVEWTFNSGLDPTNEATCAWVSAGAKAPNVYAVQNEIYPESWTGWTLDGNTTTYSLLVPYTYVYSGWIWLDNETYSFCCQADNSSCVWVDGTLVADANRFGHVFPFTPQRGAGWYPFKCAVYFCYSRGGSRKDNNTGADLWGIGFMKGSGAAPVGNHNDWTAALDPGDGSVLRTAPAARDGTVESYRVSGGKLFAELSFGSWQIPGGATLKVAYGPDFGGDEVSSWMGRDTVVASLSASDSAYSFEGLPGAGTTVRYARFYAESADGQWWNWIGGPLYLPDGAIPAFGAGLAVSGDGGDLLRVSGTVASAGSGETATLKVYVSGNPDLSDAEEWIGGRFAPGAAISFDIHSSDVQSSRYIAPGSVYYVRVVLAADNGAEDVKGVFKVVTRAAAAFGDAFGQSDWGPNATFTGVLSELGAGVSATVFLYCGPDADIATMTNTLQTVVTNPNGEFKFQYEYPFVNGDVHYAYLVSNDCETAVWTQWSGVKALRLRDRYTYRWKADVHEGAWNDPDNWVADGGDPRASFPNSTQCVVHLRTDDLSTPTVISVPGRYDVASLYMPDGADGVGAKVELVGAGSEVSRIGLNEWKSWDGRVKDDLDLLLKDIRIDGYGVPFKSGMRLTLDGATVTCSTETAMHAPNATLELRNGSLWHQSDWYIRTTGDNVLIVIDDSTMQFAKGNAIIDLSINEGSGRSRVEFRGTHPLLIAGNGAIKAGGDAACPYRPEIVFRVPQGGYETPPVSCTAAFLSGSKTPVVLSVPRDAPYRPGRSFETVLVAAPAGVETTMLEFSPPRDDTKLGYDDASSPTAVKFSYSPLGLRLILR